MPPNQSFVIAFIDLPEDRIATLGTPIQTVKYASIAAAKRAIVGAMAGDLEENLASMATIKEDDRIHRKTHRWYVYEDQEQADDDRNRTGTFALACIERAGD